MVEEVNVEVIDIRIGHPQQVLQQFSLQVQWPGFSCKAFVRDPAAFLKTGFIEELNLLKDIRTHNSLTNFSIVVIVVLMLIDLRLCNPFFRLCRKIPAAGLIVGASANLSLHAPDPLSITTSYISSFIWLFIYSPYYFLYFMV